MTTEQRDPPRLTVLVSGSVPSERLEALRSELSGVDLRYFDDQDDLEAEVESADVVAGELSTAAFERAVRLRWQHSWAAGPDRALTPAMMTSDVVLTCSKGNGGIPLAEHALLLMLMLSGDAPSWFTAQQEHRWDHHLHGELAGQTVGIVGLGHAGSHLAHITKALGMTTLGVRRRPDPVPDVDKLYRPDQLAPFLGRCDYVVVTAPMTDATRGMFDEAAFRSMKPTSRFICISRGGIADDDALLRALTAGWIAGAGIDAHGAEPLPADSPFWDAPNTIITPHNGATSLMSAVRRFDSFEENLRRYVAGEPLDNVVDKAAGY